MTEASPASASSSATSSVVAAVSTWTERTPIRSSWSVWPRAAAVDPDHDVAGGPQRLGRGPVGVLDGVRQDHDVGPEAGLEQDVGAAVDADQHRVAARGGRRLIAASSARCSWPGTTTTTGRPAIRVAGRRQAASVQQQVLLAAQELGAVVGERLQLGGQTAAGVGHLVAR